MWIATMENLNDLILREKITHKLKPTRDRLRAHRIFTSLYSRYVIIVNNLGDIYDQTLQVQKRAVVKRILELATNRMFELQNELKEIEMSDFLLTDETLIENKFIPENIDILCPFYFPMMREQQYQDVINRPDEDDGFNDDDVDENNLTAKEIVERNKRLAIKHMKPSNPIEDAVNLIKRHELARQARCLLLNMQLHPKYYTPKVSLEEIQKYEFYFGKDQVPLLPVKRTIYRNNFSKNNEHVETLPTLEETHVLKSISQTNLSNKSLEITINLYTERNEAAIKIQQYFRNYQIKKQRKYEKLKYFQEIGMINEFRGNLNDIKLLAKQQREKNRVKKKMFDQKFVSICEDTKSRILKIKTPWIMEDISDHIRNWFQECYDAADAFDKYPPALKGGTILVITGKTMEPYEFAEDLLKTPEIKKKEKEDEKKKKKAILVAKREVAKRQKEKKLKKAQQDLVMGKEWEFNESEFITKNYINLDQSMKDYEDEWCFINEFTNPEHNPYMEFIEIDKYAEVHMELRQTVDELMRIEYELLRMALSQDQKTKYKAPKKEKKPKAPKKKKTPKSQFGNKSINEIYDELIKMEIIIQLPKRELAEFIGDLNYAANELKNYEEKEPNICMGEIKNVIRSCILSMGPLIFKKPKSICLAGPRGCGKKLIVHAVATEIDAVVFDLSPIVVFNIKDKLQEWIPKIKELAKLLQPSIFFIDGAHCPFIKKIPLEMKEFEPKLISKYLPTILKQIQPTDRIILMGTTNEPWNSQIPKMTKTYEKIILLPGSCDYNTTFLTWQTCLLNKQHVDPLMDFSTLSKITINYSVTDIIKCVDRVVNVKRCARLDRYPLQIQELIEGLLEIDCLPVDQNILDQFKAWFSKTNKYAKIRAKFVNERERKKLEKKK